MMATAAAAGHCGGRSAMAGGGGNALLHSRSQSAERLLAMRKFSSSNIELRSGFNYADDDDEEEDEDEDDVHQVHGRPVQDCTNNGNAAVKANCSDKESAPLGEVKSSDKTTGDLKKSSNSADNSSSGVSGSSSGASSGSQSSATSNGKLYATTAKTILKKMNSD